MEAAAGGGGFRRGGFNDRPREMHKITCSACGNEGEFLSNHEAVHLYSAEIASQSRRAVQAVHGPHNDAPAENHKNQATLNKHA